MAKITLHIIFATLSFMMAGEAFAQAAKPQQYKYVFTVAKNAG